MAYRRYSPSDPSKFSPVSAPKEWQLRDIVLGIHSWMSDPNHSSTGPSTGGVLNAIRAHAAGETARREPRSAYYHLGRALAPVLAQVISQGALPGWGANEFIQALTGQTMSASGLLQNTVSYLTDGAITPGMETSQELSSDDEGWIDSLVNYVS